MEFVDPVSIREFINTPWDSQDDNDKAFRKVLDHGYVRLVDHLGSDLSVVRAARVSYNAEWRAGEDSGSDKRLINYLIRNKHTSPFEHVSFTLDVKAPIFVLRQWMRHRTWSFNEVSGRYTELPEEYYIPDSSLITTQSTDNKQMRTTEEHPDSDWLRDLMCLASDSAFVDYRNLLAKGCPRELARIILPLNTYSHMFATVNLHNLLKFCQDRLAPGAQWEIQQYATAIIDLIKPIVPVCVEAFESVNKTS